LEGCRRVCQVKKHDFRLKQALICDEGSLPLIASPDINIVIAPTNIELSKDFRILELIDDIGGQSE
jgi:hypothetical protein